MNLGFQYPLVLTALALAAAPLLITPQRPDRFSSIELIPEDRVSRFGEWFVRGAGASAIGLIVLGIAGPYNEEQQIERLGKGAHIVMLLDRSASMNQNFTGRYMGGRSSESKAQYAWKFLTEFVQKRPQDLFAIASFSTSPIYTLPLTQDHEAVLSALQAAALKGRGITNMAGGLAMALDYFSNSEITGARVIVLVSDGATRIDPDTRERLRQWFSEAQASLYWIYLRNPNSVRLTEKPANPNESTTPEYFLNRFFSELNVPYKAYEADSPDALLQAINDIDRLENKPVIYYENVPRKDLAPLCWMVAVGLLSLLFILKWIEIRTETNWTQ